MLHLNNINDVPANTEPSQEVVAELAGIGIIGALIGTLAIISKIKESREKKVLEFVTRHYQKITTYVKTYEKDDPFYFEISRPLYKVKEVADTATAFLQVLQVALTAPKPSSYQDSREYMESFEKFLAKKHLPKMKDYLSSEMTLSDAGYLEHELVKKVFSTERDICFNLNKFWQFSCHCAYELDADPNEIYYKLMGRIKRFTDGIGAQAIITDCDFVFYIVRAIVKHILKKYEKWKKSNEELDVKEINNLLEEAKKYRA